MTVTDILLSELPAKVKLSCHNTRQIYVFSCNRLLTLDTRLFREFNADLS